MPTWSSGVSLRGSPGSNGSAILNGTGAPSASNPGGAIVAGSYYIRTDTTPNQLFGPYSAANGWPSSFVAMGGGSFQVSSGPPASALGSIGDCCIDTTNAFFYPPKTASGWTVSPIQMQGPTGPSGQIQPAMGGYVASYGPGCQFAGQTMGTGATSMYYNGTSILSQFVATANQALYGATLVNYGSTGATIYPYLYNFTTSAILYNYNSGNGLATGTTAAVTLGPTAFPLVAGNTYGWAAQRVTAAASYVQINPIYTAPASGGQSVSCPGNFIMPSTTISSTATVLGVAGLPNQTGYYQNALPSYLYSVGIQLQGTGTAQVTLYNSTSGGALWVSPTLSATTAAPQQVYGPFGLNTAYIPTNNVMYWRIAGSGTMAANVNMYVCQ